MTKFGAVLAAAVVMTCVGAQAHAQGAIASLSSSPIWWGSAGDHADLLVSYDSAAKAPLTVYGAYEQGIDKSAVNQGLAACGAAQPNGTVVIQPGGYCFVRGYRSGAAIIARFVATNGSTAASFVPFIHASIEVRDANDNTVQRAELH